MAIQGMLFPILLLYVTSYVSAKFCEKNQFWSSLLERCENCSRCVHPEIVIRPCQGHKDTVCGPLSELNLDWSFMRHPESNAKSSNPQKEMVQTFKENLKEIRQHEKHVREKQRHMQERLKLTKNANEDYNEIEGGDIFVGDRDGARGSVDKKELWEKLKELGRSTSAWQDDGDERDPSDRERNREKSLKLFQTLLHLPVVLDSFSRSNLLHFDDDEAFEITRGRDRQKTKDEHSPGRLRYDENGVLIKGFGFSKPDDSSEAVVAEKLYDGGKHEQKTPPSDRFSPDLRLGIAAFLLVVHSVIILVIATYCIRKNGRKIKGYFVTDMGEIQTWILPKDKGNNTYPSSGVYKPTTEVKPSSNSSKCKYLERLISKNGKKKVNFYVGVKLPPEMKPLTEKHPCVHKPVGDSV